MTDYEFEKNLRKKIIQNFCIISEKNYIDSSIGLPGFQVQLEDNFNYITFNF